MEAETELVEECAPASWSEVIGYPWPIRAWGVRGIACTGHASCTLAIVGNRCSPASC